LASTVTPDAILRRLRERPNLRKVAGNTAWRYADQILRMTVGFLVGTYVARYLGPEQFGLFNFASATIALVGSLSSLGLDTVVIKHLCQESEQANEILGSSFAMRTLGGAIGLSIALVLGLTTKAAGSDDQWVIIILALSLPFLGFDTIDLWFQSRLESRSTIMAKALPYLACSLAKVALVMLQCSVLPFAVVVLLESMTAALGLVLAYTRQRRYVRQWHTSLRRSLALLNESWPLIINGFAILVQARIDQLLLGQMLGNHDLGLYSAAVRVSEVFNFIPVVLVTSVFPAMLKTWKEDPALARKRLLDLYRLMTWISLAIAVPVSVFAGEIMSLLYGTRFLGAEGILAMFAWTRFLTAFGMARGIVIAAEGRFRFSMVCAVVGSALNVGLNILLIPHFGCIGSVAAMMLSFVVTTFVLDLLYPPMRPNFVAMIHGMVTFPRLVLALRR
jgi:PST family polysaccharide transporter